MTTVTLQRLGPALLFLAMVLITIANIQFSWDPATAATMSGDSEDDGENGRLFIHVRAMRFITTFLHSRYGASDPRYIKGRRGLEKNGRASLLVARPGQNPHLHDLRLERIWHHRYRKVGEDETHRNLQRHTVLHFGLSGCCSVNAVDQRPGPGFRKRESARIVRGTSLAIPPGVDYVLGACLAEAEEEEQQQQQQGAGSEGAGSAQAAAAGKRNSKREAGASFDEYDVGKGPGCLVATAILDSGPWNLPQQQKQKKKKKKNGAADTVDIADTPLMRLTHNGDIEPQKTAHEDPKLSKRVHLKAGLIPGLLQASVATFLPGAKCEKHSHPSATEIYVNFGGPSCNIGYELGGKDTNGDDDSRGGQQSQEKKALPKPAAAAAAGRAGRAERRFVYQYAEGDSDVIQPGTTHWAWNDALYESCENFNLMLAAPDAQPLHVSAK